MSSTAFSSLSIPTSLPSLGNRPSASSPCLFFLTAPNSVLLFWTSLASPSAFCALAFLTQPCRCRPWWGPVLSLAVLPPTPSLYALLASHIFSATILVPPGLLLAAWTFTCYFVGADMSSPIELAGLTPCSTESSSCLSVCVRIQCRLADLPAPA